MKFIARFCQWYLNVFDVPLCEHKYEITHTANYIDAWERKPKIRVIKQCNKCCHTKCEEF